MNYFKNNVNPDQITQLFQETKSEILKVGGVRDK